MRQMADSLRVADAADWLATETDREFDEPPEEWHERPAPVQQLYRARIETILAMMARPIREIPMTDALLDDALDRRLDVLVTLMQDPTLSISAFRDLAAQALRQTARELAALELERRR